MAEDEGMQGCIMVLVGIAVVAAIVAMIVMALMAVMTVGSVYGAGVALRNYGLAFANNVKPQRVTA